MGLFAIPGCFTRLPLLYFTLYTSIGITACQSNFLPQQSEYVLVASCQNDTLRMHANICQRHDAARNDCISRRKFESVVKDHHDCQIVTNEKENEIPANMWNEDQRVKNADSQKQIWKRQIRRPDACYAMEPPKPGKVVCQIFWRTMDCAGTCNNGYIFMDGSVRKVHRCYNGGQWVPSASFLACKQMPRHYQLKPQNRILHWNPQNMEETITRITFAQCVPNCHNGGTCIAINTCACINEYRGAFCQYPLSLCSISKTSSASSWQCNHTNIESLCKVSCYPPGSPQAEYEARIHFCTIQGVWQPTLPACVSRSVVAMCFHPGMVENGRVYSEEGDMEIFSSGHKLYFSCQDSFQIEGESSIYCLSNGLWSAPKPICTRKNVKVCPNPGKVTNGGILNGAGNLAFFSPGSRLSFSCQEDFHMEGEATIYCQSSGVWSAPTPVCTRKTKKMCQNPGEVINGGMRSENGDLAFFSPGSILYFSCQKDFDMEGATTIYCQSNGLWSAPKPVCSRKTVKMCQNPGEMVNGKTRSEEGDLAFYSPGSKLFFSCQENFHMEGETTIYCQSNGLWSAPNPVCSRKTEKMCQNPGEVINGELRSEEGDLDFYSPGSKLFFSCQENSHMEGETTIYCQSNGLWSAPKPTCSRKTVKLCPNPAGELVNGEIRSEEGDLAFYSPGSKLFFSCQENFRMEGEATIYCQSNGLWSAPNPVCTRKTAKMCLNPGKVVDGETHIETDDFYFFTPGSKLFFSCEEGFYMEGESTIYCQSNGKWSAPKPTCPRKATNKLVSGVCSEVISPQHAEVRIFLPDTERLSMSMLLNKENNSQHDASNSTMKSFPEGTKVQFKCRSQFYTLYGSEYQTCQTGGVWSGKRPVCLPNCGKSESPRQPLIVDGRTSEIGMWPWQVALSIYRAMGDDEDGMSSLVCGAALISEKWVLTAAHCVAMRHSKFPLPTGAVIAHLGKHFRNSSRDDEHVQTRMIRRIQIHEDYDFVKFEADIALLELDGLVELNTRIQPICLPTETTSRDNLRPGKLGVVTGWGLTEDGSYSTELHETVLSVVSREDCEESYRQGLRSIVVSERMVCAGGGPSDTCSGDSGGPFAFLDPQSSRSWVLEGIISWGSGAGCGRNREYSGFTKVIRFMDWIKTYL